MKTAVLLAAGLLGIALTASAARADTPPSIWDKAKDPSLSEHWALHVRVERLLSGPARDEEVPRLEAIGDKERRTMAALAMLEDAGAADSPDVMLRFDLGTVLYELAGNSERIDLYTKAARVLEGALAMSPDGSGSTQALGRLAEAYAKLDRPFDEIATWRRYIPRLLDPRARAVDTMNMGEAEMRIGRVDDALGHVPRRAPAARRRSRTPTDRPTCSRSGTSRSPSTGRATRAARSRPRPASRT